MHVAVLAGGHEIVASTAQFSPAEPSTWTVVAVMDDGRLAKVVIQFDTENYDLEQEMRLQEKSSTATVVEAWVRPLGDVVCLEIRKVGQRRGPFNQPAPGQFDVGDIRLKFSSGEELELGVDQLEMSYHEDRERTDQLIAVLRARTGM